MGTELLEVEKLCSRWRQKAEKHGGLPLTASEFSLLGASFAKLRSQLQAAQAERDRMLEGERGGLHKEVRVLRARAEDAERERDALQEKLDDALYDLSRSEE